MKARRPRSINALPVAVRSKLYVSPTGQSPRCYDVALTKSGDGSAAVSVARDVTAEIAAQADLRRLAFHDGLTGMLRGMLRQFTQTSVLSVLTKASICWTRRRLATYS